MAVNQRVFDTAIVNKTNHSRAIGPRIGVASSNQYLIAEDGTLNVIAAVSKDEYNLIYSTDNGFTWSTRQNIEDWDSNDITHIYGTTDTQGPFINLYKMRDFESSDTIYKDNWMLMYGVTNAMYRLGSYAGATLVSVWGTDSTKFGFVFNINVSGGYSASTGDGEAVAYSAYQSLASGWLTIVGQNLNSDSVSYTLQEYRIRTGSIMPGIIAAKAKGAYVHLVFVDNTYPDALSYVPYTKAVGSLQSGASAENGSFAAHHIIHSGVLAVGSSTFTDPAIDVDGYGTIGVVYSNIDSTSGYYAISHDSGTTWTYTSHTPPTGYSGYIEKFTNSICPCNDILAGTSGFLVSSLFMKDDSADLFVKEIPSWGTATDTWHRVNSVDGDVLAGKFFKYMNEATPTFGDKSAIRMVYQVGEMNHDRGESSVYSTVYHERLSNLAYPSVFTGTSFTKDNIDYYASGYIDDNTALYIKKIGELGMEYSFSRYDPVESSEINGKGGYAFPITTEHEACVDPGSYGFPSVARNNSDFAEYIERDTRKIFYRPDLFLDRNFILNKGGFLKRTVWTIRIMGNDYELAQIVPRWLDGKIVYYEANLYVIGPSNDPFSKTILPSET